MKKKESAKSESPSKLIDGRIKELLDGNTRRAIDFPEGAKLNEKALKALIRAAVALNQSRAKAKR